MERHLKPKVPVVLYCIHYSTSLILEMLTVGSYRETVCGGRVSGQEHCPTLWVGTNAGTIYIHQLTVPSADKRSTDEVQCVLCMFHSLSTNQPVSLVAFLLCVGAQFCRCYFLSFIDAFVASGFARKGRSLGGAG